MTRHYVLCFSVCNQPPRPTQPSIPPGSVNECQLRLRRKKAGTVHSVSGWTRGVQVKLWEPLRTRAVPELLRDVFTMRRYIHIYLYLKLPVFFLSSNAVLGGHRTELNQTSPHVRNGTRFENKRQKLEILSSEIARKPKNWPVPNLDSFTTDKCEYLRNETYRQTINYEVSPTYPQNLVSRPTNDWF